MIYRSKPSLVEAVHYTGGNLTEVVEFCGKKITSRDFRIFLLAGKDGAQEWVPVPVGHWIVHSINDKTDIWPVEEEYFQTKYERENNMTSESSFTTVRVPDTELRARALQAALETPFSPSPTIEKIIQAAAAYYLFLKGRDEN